jgi:antitoxin component YwqK of YwqJK toxin-antitoxin module
MIARGEYFHGKRHGKWTRWYTEEPEILTTPATTETTNPQSVEMTIEGEGEEVVEEKAAAVAIGPLSGPDFDGFRRPFVSQASFLEGKLMGIWTIVDADDRPICAFEFDNDQLHGAAVAYYPNGQKRRQMEFEKGVLVGEWKEWESNGTVGKIDAYVDGRRKVPYTERYDSGEKYCQGHYLFARATVNVKHDWWNGVIDIQLGDDSGEKLKQGQWTYWYRNGGKMTEGDFEAGNPTGLHVWWYENGQQKAQGEYLAGQQTGNWSWWHENGLKKTEGQIVENRKIGIWSEWKEDGSLVQERAHNGSYRSVGAPAPEPQPQARAVRPAMNRRR